MRKIKLVIVHHSAGPTSQPVEEIRKLHLARGWADIGYHWVIREEQPGVWQVFQGRPEGVIGAHDVDQNSESIGVCLLGNYEAVFPSAAAWNALVETVIWILRRYGLSVSAVEGHREHEPASTPTACPGFAPDSLRTSIAMRMAE